MDQEQIKRLASFDSRGACVLSAYLAAAEWLAAHPPDRVVLATFACTPLGLWERFNLHLPVRNRLVFEATLEALFLGEVRTLVIADRARAEGSECPNCGRLTAGGPGSVEVVHGEPAQRLLASGGGMGAFLRYSP